MPRALRRRRRCCPFCQVATRAQLPRCSHAPQLPRSPAARPHSALRIGGVTQLRKPGPTSSTGGGRRYWHEVQGRRGWRARYVKQVDSEETVVRFWQEIYQVEIVDYH
jgi:hypothetical protein